MPYTIFIDGSAGTTGLRILERLQRRAADEPLTVRTLTGEDRKDPDARAAAINASDAAILCLPDAAAREILPRIRPEVRVLDTSTAHRTAPGWVYGLPSSTAPGRRWPKPGGWRCPAAMPPASSPWRPRWWKPACCPPTPP